MPTNKRQRNGQQPCAGTVHFTPIYPAKPCTYHIECVTCPTCLWEIQEMQDIKDVYAVRNLIELTNQPEVQKMMDQEDEAREAMAAERKAERQARAKVRR